MRFIFPRRCNEISILYIGSTAVNAAVTSRRVRGSMKSTLRVDEIPACTGMKCSRVAPARNTRAKLGYVAGLEEPRNLGFSEHPQKMNRPGRHMAGSRSGVNFSLSFTAPRSRGLQEQFIIIILLCQEDIMYFV